jgi:hypothetical protein
VALDDNGDVVASFAGFGTFRYSNNSGWSMLTSAVASQVAVDSTGNVFAEFPGYGLFSYQFGGPGWQQLSTTDAAFLFVS